MPAPTRRSFLLGSAAAALLAACGDDGDAAPTIGGDGDGDTAPGTDASTPILGVTFDRNGLLVAGIAQRAPFLLFESSGGLVRPTEAPAELRFDVVDPDGRPLEPVTVARHGDGIDRAYYPMRTTFPGTGLHTVRTEVDGNPLEYAVNVNEPGAVAVPQVGDRMPVAATPTEADPLGVQTICTREATCPFHAVSLDAALADGRPVAVLWSTPAYCQVAICGPVLDLLIEVAPQHPDVAVVHAEVYPNDPPPDGRPPASFTDAFGLTFEPSLFVADATGAIVSRLDNIYDSTELGDALAAAAG